MRKPKPRDIEMVVFRPVGRDGSQDFLVPKTVAKALYKEGKIAWDVTNGGYMPRAGVKCDMREHRIQGVLPMWWHNRP